MAAYNLSPICNNWQSFLDSGAINNGGWIYTYLAGTSTPLPTYTSSTGSIANPSQIQLLANGRPPNPIWLPSGFAYKFIIYDHLLNQVGITEDNIVGVGDTGFAVTSEWIQLNGGPPVYSSANVFTFPGNQTGIFLPGRRVLAYVTAGIVYGYVTNSSFGAGNTTVTLVMDSGQALDSGMSAIYYAFLNSLHASIPERILYQFNPTALITPNWAIDQTSGLLQNTGFTQPDCSFNNSAQRSTAGVFITYGGTDWNQSMGGLTSATTGTIQIPFIGRYTAKYIMEQTSNPGPGFQVIGGIYKNGVLNAASEIALVTSNALSTIGATIDFAANAADLITFGISANSGGASMLAQSFQITMKP